MATMMTKTMMMTTIMIRIATEMTMTPMATSLMTRMRMKTTMTTMSTENPIEEMIKLSSVWCPSVRLSVRNSYLEILPSGIFFPREK